MADKKYIKKGGKVVANYINQQRLSRKNKHKIIYFLSYAIVLLLLIGLSFIFYYYSDSESKKTVLSPELDQKILNHMENRKVIKIEKKTLENGNIVDIESVQYGAVIGEKVRWTKTAKLDEGGEINFEDEIPENALDVSINEGEGSIFLEYYTDPPYIISEESFLRGKRIKAGSDLHYENVLIYVGIPEIWNVKDSFSIGVFWLEENKYIDTINVLDLDSNGVYDYVEWIAPHLSNQTFDIILITRAEHLDSDRTFISDIFEEVKELDNVWSETIPNQDYVRVTFERELTSDNDITLFPRIVSGTPRIEVYEVDQDILIAEFDFLTSNEYNTVFLDGLGNRVQDTFDLRILEGDVEIDHIIDPPTRLSDTAFSFALNSIGVGEQTTVQGTYDVSTNTGWSGTLQLSESGGGASLISDICQPGVAIRTTGCSETFSSCSCNPDNTFTCVNQPQVTGATITWAVEGCEVSGDVRYVTKKISGDSVSLKKKDRLTVTAALSIAIDLSANLSSGIVWNVQSLPAFNLSAEENNGDGDTFYYINISSSSNVDVYVKADSDLVSDGGNVIGVGNETYSFNLTDSTVPSIVKTPLSLNFLPIITNLPAGFNVVYLKFFLNVDGGQAVGNYNNTLSFIAVENGQTPP